MKRSLLFVLSIIMAITLLTSANYVSCQNTSEGIGHASWTEHYYSVSEMLKDADLAIVGTVVNQRTELRNELVFTFSEISVSYIFLGDLKEETIEIMQTGGFYGNYYTPPISEAPILIINEAKVFCLKKSSEGHYLISGGYQGVAEFDTEKDSPIDDIFTKAFVDKNIEHLRYSYYPTWTVTTVQYDMTNISRTTVAVSGIESWNWLANINYLYYPQTYSPVDFWENNYGDTGWYGYTSVYPANGGVNDHITGADVYLNAYHWTGGNSKTDNQYKAIVCHEAGHALGILEHQDGLTSVMRSDVYNFWNSYQTPRSYDISLLQGMYPY